MRTPSPCSLRLGLKTPPFGTLFSVLTQIAAMVMTMTLFQPLKYPSTAKYPINDFSKTKSLKVLRVTYLPNTYLQRWYQIVTSAKLWDRSLQAIYAITCLDLYHGPPEFYPHSPVRLLTQINRMVKLWIENGASNALPVSPSFIFVHFSLSISVHILAIST